MGKAKTIGIAAAALVVGAVGGATLDDLFKLATQTQPQAISLPTDNLEKRRVEKLISLDKGVREVVDIQTPNGKSRTYTFEYVGSRAIGGGGQYEVKINDRGYFFGGLDSEFLLEYDGEGKAPTISLDRTVRTGEEINTTLVLYLENATAKLSEVKNP